MRKVLRNIWCSSLAINHFTWAFLIILVTHSSVLYICCIRSLLERCHAHILYDDCLLIQIHVDTSICVYEAIYAMSLFLGSYALSIMVSCGSLLVSSYIILASCNRSKVVGMATSSRGLAGCGKVTWSHYHNILVHSLLFSFMRQADQRS